MIDQFNTVNENITLVRGDTLAFGIELYDVDETGTISTPFNQDLDSCFFSVRKDYTDGNNVFQKSLANGITKVAAGKYRVRIAPEDTANLDVGNYYYDLEIGVNGDYFTVLKGLLELEYDVTHENFASESALSQLIDGSILSITESDFGNITSIKTHVFNSCTDLVSVKIPASVQSIGAYAFANCTALQSIVIPDGVEVLNGYTFNGCTALKSVVLPASITEMKNFAFNNCTAMESFTCKATTPPTITTNTFAMMKSDAIIYVPAASVDAYKAAQYWSARAQYIQAIGG